MAAFAAKMVKLVIIEKEADLEEEKIHKACLSDAKLVASGVYINGLVVVDTQTGLYGRCTVKLSLAKEGVLPESRFRSRDIVELRKQGRREQGGGGDSEEFVLQGVVLHISETSVSCSFDEFPSTIPQGKLCLLRLANEITYQRYMSALGTLNRWVDTGIAGTGDGKTVCSEVLTLLYGSQDPEPRLQKKPLPWSPINEGLNSQQLKAVDVSLSALDLALIHGPPGTGKSVCCVEFILQSVKRGCKVLVCAPSNMAVDNLAERLALHKVSMIRLGHPARMQSKTLKHCLDAVVARSNGGEVSETIRCEINSLVKSIEKQGKSTREVWSELKTLRKELRHREKKAVVDAVSHADIILTTCTGAASSALFNVTFDVVVIDEAAQGLEVDCLIPILKGKKVVLAGDHKQLGPVVKSQEAANKGLGVSLFDRLMALPSISQTVSVMLCEQYRMHLDIMAWSSSEMYESKMIADVSVKGHVLAGLEGVKTTDETSVPFVLVDTTGCDAAEDDSHENEVGSSRSNRAEAFFVKEYLLLLLSASVSVTDIGIITPYNAQVSLLKSMLLPSFAGLEIGTVDGFQGREKEAILISMVRSNSNKEIGFLQDDRRMNVAITRARRHVAIFVDSDTVSSNPFLTRLISYGSEHADYRSAQEFRVDDTTVSDRASSWLQPSSSQYVVEAASASGSKPSPPAPQQLPPASKKTKAKKKPKSQSAGDDVDSSQHHNNKVAESEDWSDQKIAEIVMGVKHRLNNEGFFVFPSTLSSYLRMKVHSLAEHVDGIHHFSHVEGELRSLCLYHEDSFEKLNKFLGNKVTPPVVQGKEVTVRETSTKQKPQAVVELEIKEDKAPEIKVEDFGESRGKWDLLKTEVESGEDDAEVEPESAAVSKAKKPNAKKKKNYPKPKEKDSDDVEVEVDDGFNDMLKDFDVTVCRTKGCKKDVKFMGFVCPHCKERFCVEHRNAVLHGCRDEAKARARAEDKKPKALSSSQKSVLQDKLKKTQKSVKRETASSKGNVKKSK